MIGGMWSVRAEMEVTGEGGDQVETELMEVKTETTAIDDESIEIEEDIFDGEDELYKVDFSEAEDISEKKIIRYIFKICRDGKVEKLKHIGDQYNPKKIKKWINSRDDQYDTPLHYAARNCDKEMMEALFDLKAKPDEKGNNQMTPLHNAAR